MHIANRYSPEANGERVANGQAMACASSNWVQTPATGKLDFDLSVIAHHHREKRF
jgi:hypothetical protein